MNPKIEGSGFWIEENIFSEVECDHLLENLSGFSGKRRRAGARHLMSHPTIAALALDERLLEIARRALGRNAVPYRATLFEKSISARWLVVWHQDRALPLEAQFNLPDWGPWSLKAGVTYAPAPEWALSRIIALRIHLDNSVEDNGPLRIIAGSHVAGVMSEKEILAYAGARQPLECLIGRGGVLAMRPLLIHSSAKPHSNRPRRVLHIEYADGLDLAPGIRLAIA